MKIFKSFILILTIAVLSSCGSGESKTTASNASSEVAAKPQKSIVIYGSDQCSHCVEFKEKLDSVGLTYTFNDVDLSDQYYNDMVRLVRSSGHQGGFGFPVVLVDNSSLFLAPELEPVLEMMK